MGPRLPGTVDEAREVLSGAEFFCPLSDFPGETGERRAYVRQFHVVLARMVCRLEHSQFVLTGEASPEAEPGEGEAGDGVLYWGYSVNIWREDGDTVVLADPDGTVVFETEYGPVG